MKAAFLLHELEELSVAEVAMVLGIPEGTVKSRLFQARERLRSRLSQGREVIYGTEVYES